MAYRLPERAEKAQYVRRKFDEIAARYDLFNDLITQGQHRWWKHVLVRRLGLHADARVLDLCCGTADIAARAARHMGPGGVLVAADFSPRMLGLARQRLGALPPGGPACAVLQADAMRLPFAPHSFDAVTIGYGLRNVTDLDGCLAEVQRVLRPGGAFASLDTGRVSNPLLRPLAEFYMFRVVPRIGRALQPGQDMFDYLPSSTTTFPDPEALARRIEGAGYTRVELVPFLFGASALHLGRKPG